MLVIMVVHILDAIPGAVVGHKGFIQRSAEWVHYSQVATVPVSYAPHSQPAPIKTLCCTMPWRLFSMWYSSALMVAGSGPWVKCRMWRKVSPDSALGKNPLLSRKHLGAYLNPPSSELEEMTPFLSGISEEMTRSELAYMLFELLKIL